MLPHRRLGVLVSLETNEVLGMEAQCLDRGALHRGAGYRGTLRRGGMRPGAGDGGVRGHVLVQREALGTSRSCREPGAEREVP